MLLTIIFCFRDRELSRVQKSLRSLNQQTNHNFNIVFVDYGSKSSLATEVKSEVEQYENATYHYCHAEGLPWNRSHALNIGIRLAKTDFVFTADIDLLFHSDFISHLYQLTSQTDAAFMPCFLLPENFSDWANFSFYNQFPKTTSQGKGLSLIKKSILEEIQGYDEFYNFWGREDNDLYKRLSLSGVNPIFHQSPCLLYHQWHPLSQASHEIFPKNWNEYMRNYFNDNESITRNSHHWGQLLDKEDRPAIRALSNTEVQHIAFDQIKNDGLLYLDTLLHQGFYSSSSLHFVIHTNQIHTFNNSRTIKYIKKINTFLRKKSSPIRVTSKNRALYYSVFDIRDRLVYFIQNHQSRIKDYYMDVSTKNQSLTFVLIKK